MLELRSYLNDGGKLLYGGQNAGYQYSFAYPFDPVANESCNGKDDAVALALPVPLRRLPPVLPRRRDLQRRRRHGRRHRRDAGYTAQRDRDRESVPRHRLDVQRWRRAANQTHTASFLTTSSLLPDGAYPQYSSDAPAAFARSGAAPFEPFSGSGYAYSDRSSGSYKRLTHAFDLTGVAPAEANLGFQALL